MTDSGLGLDIVKEETPPDALQHPVPDPSPASPPTVGFSPEQERVFRRVEREVAKEELVAQRAAERERKEQALLKRSPVCQDRAWDDRTLQGIAHPRCALQWFQRRLYLEDKLHLFDQLALQVSQEGMSLNEQQRTRWKLAREQFGFKSQQDEKARCQVLEDGQDEAVMRRAGLVWELEAERRASPKVEFGNGRESSYLQDVKWAYQNWPTYVRRRGPGEWSITREAELIKNVPSQGAYGLILYAQEDLKKFQDLCRGVLLKSEVPNEKQNADLEFDKSLSKLRELVGGFTT